MSCADDLFVAMLESLGCKVVDVTDRGVAGIDYLDDNADQASAEFPLMPARCADCAYTPDTSANRDLTTGRLARECADSRHAFWCHKSVKGEFPTILCAGWAEAIERADQPTTPQTEE